MIKTRLKLHDQRVLWPEHKGLASVLSLQEVTPRAIFESTYQQNDAVSFGSIFQRNWWSYWRPQGPNLSPVYEVDVEGNAVEAGLTVLPPLVQLIQVQSWDLAFSEKKTAAFNVGQVWGKRGADVFLLDMVRGRWDMPTVVEKLEALTKRWPMAKPILIENKANGPAVIQTLRRKVPGIVAVEPKGDKVSRANAVTPYVQSGNVFLPHPSLYPWVKDFIDETSTFPSGEFKDIVDTMTQGLKRLYNIANYEQAGRQTARAGTVVTG